MKDFFISTSRKLFTPAIALMIAYHVLYQYIASFAYLIVIKVVLVILFIVLFLGWIFDYFSGYKGCDKSPKAIKKIVRYFYLKSYLIVVNVFCYYSSVYFLFFLGKKSILFNYLVLFLFGLFVGCRITRKANELFKDI